MVVNFRPRGISQGARKLDQTLTLIKKKKKLRVFYIYIKSELVIYKSYNMLILVLMIEIQRNDRLETQQYFKNKLYIIKHTRIN